MSLNRYNTKRDSTEPAIRHALAKVGAEYLVRRRQRSNRKGVTELAEQDAPRSDLPAGGPVRLSDPQSVTLAARVHALIAQWRATSAEKTLHHDMATFPSLVLLSKHSRDTVATFEQCADALEAALAAALAPNSEKETE